MILPDSYEQLSLKKMSSINKQELKTISSNYNYGLLQRISFRDSSYQIHILSDDYDALDYMSKTESKELFYMSRHLELEMSE